MTPRYAVRFVASLLLLAPISLAAGIASASAQEAGGEAPGEEQAPPPPPEPPKLDFLGTEEGYFPPRVEGAEYLGRIPAEPAPGSVTPELRSRIRERARSSDRVRRALGERYAFVYVDRLRPEKTRGEEEGEPTYLAVYFSHSRNATVRVPFRRREGELTIGEARRVDPAEDQPPLGLEEKELAVELARESLAERLPTDGLAGSAIVAVDDEGAFHPYRMAHVTLEEGWIGDPRAAADVNLTEREVEATAVFEERDEPRGAAGRGGDGTAGRRVPAAPGPRPPRARSGEPPTASHDRPAAGSNPSVRSRPRHPASGQRISQGPWRLTYEIDGRNGLALDQVYYRNEKVIYHANMPIVRVRYLSQRAGQRQAPSTAQANCRVRGGDTICARFGDRLTRGSARSFIRQVENNPPSQIAISQTYCDMGQPICRRTFTVDGRQWLEIGMKAKLGGYQLYQAWYLSDDGWIKGRLFSGGLHYHNDHWHHAYWRMDFDIRRYWNDERLGKFGKTWPYEVRGRKKSLGFSATRWFVGDPGRGSGVWILPRKDDGATGWAPLDLAARQYHYSEATQPWTGGVGRQYPPGHDGERMSDPVVWSVCHIYHLSDPATGSPPPGEPEYAVEGCGTDYKVYRRGTHPGAQPDLSASIGGPSCAAVGETVGGRLSVTVHNRGGAPVPGRGSVGIYLSRDRTITTGDELLIGGREGVPRVGAGGSASVDLAGSMEVPSALSPGSYYLGALVDEFDDVAESDETNNDEVIPFRVVAAGGRCP